jgi:hypothetical protein
MSTFIIVARFARFKREIVRMEPIPMRPRYGEQAPVARYHACTEIACARWLTRQRKCYLF